MKGRLLAGYVEETEGMSEESISEPPEGVDGFSGNTFLMT
jgi:hypothetical protein